MVSTTQGSIKTRKPRKTAESVTKGDAWVFATPDFNEFDKWDKIGGRDLRAGDYLAYRAPVGNDSRAILRVIVNTPIAGSTGMVSVEVVWSSAKGGRSGGPRGIQWRSLGNKAYYRMFYPSAIPAPEPEQVEESATESSTFTVALAGMDAGLVTLADVLRDNNKILCSVLAGISALHDEIREMKELCAEAWGAKQ